MKLMCRLITGSRLNFGKSNFWPKITILYKIHKATLELLFHWWIKFFLISRLFDFDRLSWQVTFNEISDIGGIIIDNLQPMWTPTQTLTHSTSTRLSHFYAKNWYWHIHILKTPYNKSLNFWEFHVIFFFWNFTTWGGSRVWIFS